MLNEWPTCELTVCFRNSFEIYGISKSVYNKIEKEVEHVRNSGRLCPQYGNAHRVGGDMRLISWKMEKSGPYPVLALVEQELQNSIKLNEKNKEFTVAVILVSHATRDDTYFNFIKNTLQTRDIPVLKSSEVKSLEFSVVICLVDELSESIPPKMSDIQLGLAISRARSHLILIGETRTIQHLKDRFEGLRDVPVTNWEQLNQPSSVHIDKRQSLRCVGKITFIVFLISGLNFSIRIKQ